MAPVFFAEKRKAQRLQKEVSAAMQIQQIIYNTIDFQRAEEPYTGNQEYLEDWVKLLEIKIYFYLHHVINISEAGENKLDKYKGLVIGKEEIVRLLKEMEKGAGQAASPGSRAEKEFIELMPLVERYLAHRAVRSIKEGVFLPFAYLSHVFQLNSFEQHCIILSLLNRLDRKYEKIFGYLQDDVTLKNPTSDLAVKLFSPRDMGLQVMDLLHTLEQKMFKYFFHDNNQQQNTLSKPFLLDKRMLDFIFDYQTGADKIDRFITLFYPGDDIPELIVQEEIQKCLDQVMAIQDGACLVFCRGPRGSGKKLQIKTLADRHKKTVVFTDSKAILKNDHKLDLANLHKTVREVRLHDAFLCLTNFEDVLQEYSQVEEMVLDLLAEISSQVETIFITSRQKWQLRKKNSGYQWFDLEINLPDRMERSAVWRHFLGNGELSEGIDLHELANKFHFTPGQIVSGLEEARQTARWQGEKEITREILYRSCYNQISHNLNEKASLIYSRYGAEDLILPAEQKQYLLNACNHVKYRHIVFDQWGFEEKLPYGKGISMLFGGPPGTGKTMAAQVIAHELGLEMYKIDLSQVVSKYIGETEKNLKAVFDEAGKSNAILFFDECDAILGKRTEVKDSHDRYANIETSFLLQKIEEYEGVSILATNFLSNIDSAFLRRINYVIHFPFPDEASREKIWRGIFPGQTPLSADVDFKFLAKQFELAGGSIKNIAVNASFLAAAAEEEVTMRQIIFALKDELTKQGKSVLSGDFGEYGFYFK